MSSMQKLMLIGNLGKDPETRYTPSGAAVTTFSVATSERWKDKQSGEQQERTTWHYCEAWGRTAEVCAEYLQKGDKVYVEGKIRQEEWEKDGQTQRMTKVRIDSVQFLTTKRNQGNPDNQYQSRPSGQQQAPAQQEAATAPVGGPMDDLDDDIPF